MSPVVVILGGTNVLARVMKEKAANVGERIREEDGVRTAISTIYTYLPRAGLDRKTIEH
jgi:sterol 3beta-glucosyltransferase